MFALLQKSYETKQYKKGLKAADAILKKFPDHGGRNFVYLFCLSFLVRGYLFSSYSFK